MLTNPFPATSGGEMDGDRRPLRIAARAAQHPQEPHATAAAIIPDGIAAWHGEWRGTLETVKATLAGLEQACETAMAARDAEVAVLVDRLVESAAADATTAAEDTRAPLLIEIRELQQVSMTLQATVDALQAAIDVERDNVKRLSAQLEAEASARAQAERERDELQQQCQGQVAVAEAQAEALRAEIQAQRAELALVRQQLEAAAGERSKMMTTFRLVQRALALSTPRDSDAAADAEQNETLLRPESGPLQPGITDQAAPDAAGTPPAPAVAAPSAGVNASPEAVEDVTRVLSQVEIMYHQDVESGRSGIEIVDRLTASLRHARSLIVTRWMTDDLDAHQLFDYRMGLLLDLQMGTAFGRHLGIAAYASRPPAVASGRDETGAPQRQAGV